MNECVIFFGGYKATQEQVNLWRASAKSQTSGIEIGAYPWPKGAANNPDGDAGVEAFKEFDSVVAAIKASPADKIYIVGHSSGCRIANKVDKALKGSTVASKVVLVALDGYRPDPDQLRRDNTEVWGAVSGTNQSYHYPDDDEKRQLGKHFREYKARTDITARFALHFSLVNTAVTNGKGNTSEGYDNCKANLEWLDEGKKPTP
jgi:hypothetical protein